MRRRRAKYLWFPILGTINDNADPPELGELSPFFISHAVGAPSLELNNVDIIPLTLDNPVNEQLAAAGETLGTAIGGRDWFCRRIVGQCFVSLATVVGQVQSSVLVTCGIFVARADPSGINPIGNNIAVEREQTYNPLSVRTISEPWLWRRSWHLGNVNSTVVDVNPARNFPAANSGYGDVRSGPHVDAKTARRISEDDRLWFAVSSIGTGGNANTGTNVQVVADFRILGQLRRSKGKSAF